MSDQGDLGDRGVPAGPAGPDERGGNGDDAGRAGDAARDEHGGHAEGADRAVPGRHRVRAQARIAVSVLGPVLLTTAYFTIPFDWLGPKHGVLPWVIVVGLLSALAVGMVITTNRVMTGRVGRNRHPGVVILLLAWAAILVFAASYWAMASRPGQFVGLQTRLDSLYFTGITMSTVGYGDIHPSGQLSRAVVLVQLVYTFVFLVSGVTALRTRTRARLEHRRGARG